ncbi:uncharacterized protein LOC131307647 [Rhododendron vialii]|uniref:uncharacterized protein LOC131307647 n=1 Tax=Rhododendron vialii TaxID=182163 RepID=UPI00265F7361|nr:uncharacterized protein LOC131307647 [Rhododendron vialii]
MDSPEDSQLTCSCGLSAKLWTSKTHRNPYRMFYSCPKYPNNQCEFFQWCDEPLLTGDKHLDELNLIGSECIRLQERVDDMQQEWDNERADWNRERTERTELTLELSSVVDDMQQEWDNERADWNRERTELTLELSTVKAELDKIKNEIKLVNESVVMPPLDKLSKEDEEEDDALVIQTI